MLAITSALEIKAFGVFKDTFRAKNFNNNELGDVLHLYRVRTTLNQTKFIKEFFLPGSNGAYLEKCCGKGNVELKITKSSFLALHALTGSSTKRNKLIAIYEGTDTWHRDIYKDSALLTIEEIEKLALNPFKIVMIRNFGEVNAGNVSEFKKLYEESCLDQLNEHIGKL